MQDRLPGPPRLIIVKIVFWESARIQDSEMRTDARPPVRVRFTAVIESSPNKTASEKFAFLVHLPPSFSCRTPGWRPAIVCVHVSLQCIVCINTSGAECTCDFGAHSWHRWKSCVKLINPTVAIVKTLKVDYSRQSTSPLVIHCRCYRACWIEPSNQALHRHTDSRPTFSSLFVLLVADGPTKHAWMVPVTSHHTLQIIKRVWG